MGRRVLGHVLRRQCQKCGRRLGTILPEMHECSGELNQALEEIAVRPVAILQPQVLQYFVRLEVLATIKAGKEPGIARVQTRRLDAREQLSHLF